VSKLSATLFQLSLAFIFLLKLFRGQIYSVPKYRTVMFVVYNEMTILMSSLFSGYLTFF